MSNFVYNTDASIGDAVAFGTITLIGIGVLIGFFAQATRYATHDFPIYKTMKEFWDLYPTVTISQFLAGRETLHTVKVLDQIVGAYEQPSSKDLLLQIQDENLTGKEDTTRLYE